jgi:alpha-amylase/alpha-mannosidase (GH57 family)
MKRLKLAFVWHMHQPYYKDDHENTTLMPWVFLHAIKDYYDIPWYAEKFSSIKGTYNLVPSLLYQLKSYINRQVNDKLLDTISKPVYRLNDEELGFLERYLFLSNEKHMIKPLKRYYQLYLKYKAHGSIQDFHEDELVDTEVLFLLSWCGNYLREHDTLVQELINKEHFYGEEDKTALIERLFAFLPQVLEYYKKIARSGRVTLSTTPYYHPITPLLLDVESAKEAKWGVNLPHMESSFREYAYQNIEMAIAYHQEIFDAQPSGFWPAEGSVSAESAQLFAQQGLKWFCTDEAILFKTLGDSTTANLYKNYQLHIDGKSIDVRFRDHYLSDAVGFEYSKKEPAEAASEFIGHLERIYKSVNFSPLVNVILDGENAWEFFPSNGQEFFEVLYSQIEQCDWIETVTMDDIAHDEAIEHVRLEQNLATGSWIGGNFDIWIGSSEKNRAWELLDRAKQEYDRRKQNLSEVKRMQIDREFMIALGSDWFWWYGDDHYTSLKREFDELFRKHLLNIYHLMEIAVPMDIYTPICTGDGLQRFHTQPIDCIYPKIDGKKSNYFEWLNSGKIDLSREFSVMDSKKHPIQIVRYGYNKNMLFFLFEGDIAGLKEQATTLVLELGNQYYSIAITDGRFKSKSSDHKYVVFCNDHNIELMVSKENSVDERVKFAFSIKNDERIIQSFPIYEEFFITINNLKLINWYI